MALVIEDGSIVSGANSYVNATDFEAFADDRGITITGTSEQLLLLAMDYLEGLYYKGAKRTSTQGLQWPRVNVMIDGYWWDSALIPNELKNAQIQTALAIDAGYNPLSTITNAVKREKVDVIEVEYATNSPMAPVLRAVSSSLAKLLAAGNGNVIGVHKG